MGYVSAISHRYALGMVDFSSMRNLPLITIPHPFKYGFLVLASISSPVVGTIYLLSVLEAVGDITATAMVSRRPIQGGRVSVPTERRRAGRWSGFCYRLRCRIITINHVCAK